MNTRAYNRIEVDYNKGIVTKTSSTSRLKDEINYYIVLPDKLKIYFPRLVGYQDNIAPYQLQIEYLDVLDLGKNNALFPALFEKILFILRDFQKYECPLLTYPANEYREDMFVKKTETEYTNLLQNKFFADISKIEDLKINGKHYKNFLQIWDNVKTLIRQRLINNNPFTVIHGDFCFSNLLWSNHGILRLIDPRGSFGMRGAWGDSVYDIAKLRHSLIGGYELLINDRFWVARGDSLDYAQQFEYKDDVLGIFTDCFGADLNYKLVEGLIFMGMIARHYDSFDRQKAMYAIGIKYLNEVLCE